MQLISLCLIFSAGLIAFVSPFIYSGRNISADLNHTRSLVTKMRAIPNYDLQFSLVVAGILVMAIIFAIIGKRRKRS